MMNVEKVEKCQGLQDATREINESKVVPVPN
jgi:hypothetical protein